MHFSRLIRNKLILLVILVMPFSFSAAVQAEMKLAKYSSAKNIESRYKDLLVLSGLATQIGYYPDYIKSGLIKNTPTKVLTNGQQLFLDFANQAYDPNRFRRNVFEHVKSTLTLEEVDLALTWLNSPLGKKITKLEAQASKPEMRVAIIDNMDDLLSQEDRLELAKQLNDAARLVNASLNRVENIRTAIYLAMSLSEPEESRMSIQEIKQRVKKQRVDMTAQYEKKILATLIYTYQGLSKEELKQFIARAESERGRKYYSVMNEALNVAMVHGGNTLGELLAEHKIKRSTPDASRVSSPGEL